MADKATPGRRTLETGGQGRASGALRSAAAAPSGEPSWRDVLQASGQMVAVGAAAIPLLGFLTRGIAFALCPRIGSPGPWHLAGAIPLSDLAVVGLGPLFSAATLASMTIPMLVIATVVVGRYARAAEQKPKTAEENDHVDHARHRLLVGRLVVSIVVLALLAAFLLWQLVTFSLSFVFGALVGTILYVWSRRLYATQGTRAIRLGSTWPLLVVYLSSASLGSSLRFTDVPVATYLMDTASTVTSGQYIELGQGTGTIYLLSCSDRSAGVVAVPLSAIRSTEYSRTQNTATLSMSVLDVVSGHIPEPLGLVTACP